MRAHVLTSDGAEQAFSALYCKYAEPVRRYAARRAGAAVADDVVSDTFLVAWRRWHELPAEPLPWLLKVAGNCMANDRRAANRAAALIRRAGGEGPVAAEPPERAVATLHQRRAIAAALGAVGDDDRELLLLEHWDGLRPREIAAVLDISPVATRARLHRAHRRFQRLYIDAVERDPAALETPAGPAAPAVNPVI